MGNEQLTLKPFLETVPILQLRDTHVAWEQGGGGSRHLILPAINLHCSNNLCGGLRMYDPHSIIYLGSRSEDRASDEFFEYRCRNCNASGKTFAVWFRLPAQQNVMSILKYGESPRFGEPRPNIVAKVLDDELSFFDRGYRAETDGLGIGAFAYYRRFVDSHKDKIFAEIRKVAVAQNAAAAIIARIDQASSRREFSAAVEELKDAIPDSLRMNGYNPLTLLYNALSDGLHNEDDVECLELARDIRTVLIALAEKTTEALKSSSELNSAVTRLGQRASKQAIKQKAPGAASESNKESE